MPSAQQAGPHGPSAPTDSDQQISGPSFDGLAAHHPSTNECISCPSAIPQDNVLLFGHSADHINFFSAREKFKGMSKDCKTQGAAVQNSPLLKNCGKDHQPLPQDVSISEGKEEEKGKVIIARFMQTFIFSTRKKQESSSVRFSDAVIFLFSCGI